MRHSTALAHIHKAKSFSLDVSKRHGNFNSFSTLPLSWLACFLSFFLSPKPPSLISIATFLWSNFSSLLQKMREKAKLFTHVMSVKIHENIHFVSLVLSAYHSTMFRQEKESYLNNKVKHKNIMNFNVKSELF